MYGEIGEILTIEELMELLYIGKNTAYQLLKSGEIKAFRIGKVWKIPRESVNEYITRKTTKQRGFQHCVKK